MDVQAIQGALKEAGFDGWLFCDFHNRDPIAYRVLGMDFGKFTSRRWFYYIPTQGEPVRLIHRVEPIKLDSLPGEKRFYLAWEQLHASLKEILGAPKKIAMQYSPLNNIPYVSMTDGGTVDLIRSFGHEIVSSADLVQIFEAVIDEAGYQSHIEASKKVYQIKDEAFQQIENALQSGKSVTEYEIQQFIVQRFDEEGMTCDGENPIVGVNDHPANPHFEPTEENTYTIKKGDTILIDLWARDKAEGSIWADITWCGFAGSNPPEEYVKIFFIDRDARKAGLAFIQDRFTKGEACYGWEVDDAVRNVIRDAGYGEYFIHRTGHSIGTEVHGNGVHIDNLETKEQRQLIPGICFSIEPGIYLEGKMAVRTEIDVFITLDSKVVVAGPEQEDLILLNV
ncbi:M24 family metallopeptidase [candidate division KSB1 bacterium]|nr:M24 family metallopeptidase [candidate division KSB1 bacterium]